MAEEQKESPEMLYEMGKRFYLPNSGAADPLLALHYFGRSAQQGYAPAQRILGTCYLEGRLTKTDYEKARQWLTAAVNQRDGQAAYSLALIYAQGLGVAKDWALAYQLLDMEGTQGITEAKLLKEKLKNELVRHHAELAAKLNGLEEKRRACYNEKQKRFIVPWGTPGRMVLAKEEFEVWLSLNMQKISQAKGEEALACLMNRYYDQMESLHKPSSSGQAA